MRSLGWASASQAAPNALGGEMPPSWESSMPFAQAGRSLGQAKGRKWREQHLVAPRARIKKREPNPVKYIINA